VFFIQFLSDIAEMYGVETWVLNQRIKRDISRFPKDFMFRLTEKEFKNLISHFVISSWGGTRKLPFCLQRAGSSHAIKYFK
jgi:hypothetical protein